MEDNPRERLYRSSEANPRLNLTKVIPRVRSDHQVPCLCHDSLHFLFMTWYTALSVYVMVHCTLCLCHGSQKSWFNALSVYVVVHKSHGSMHFLFTSWFTELSCPTHLLSVFLRKPVLLSCGGRCKILLSANAFRQRTISSYNFSFSSSVSFIWKGTEVLNEWRKTTGQALYNFSSRIWSEYPSCHEKSPIPSTLVLLLIVILPANIKKKKTLHYLLVENSGLKRTLI